MATVGLIAGWAAPIAAAGTWSMVPTPGASISLRELAGVDCKVTFCVAVGHSKTSTLAEHWNGTSWTRDATPNPAGSGSARLSGVSCTSATFCVAVGEHTTGPDAPNVKKTLIEFWNGTRWRIVPSPNPPASRGSKLLGVSCVSTTACMAVGSWGQNSTAADWTLIQRWDGTRWSIMPSPNGPGPSSSPASKLRGVSCATASYCMAVGNFLSSSFQETPLLARWNGIKWARLANPLGISGANEVNSVSCRPTLFCVAVGRRAGPNLTLALKSTGGAWSTMPVAPIDPHLGANAVSCTSSTNCAAVGRVVQRWNGTIWELEPSPTIAPGRMRGVRCVQAKCMAVGSTDAFTPLAMRYG